MKQIVFDKSGKIRAEDVPAPAFSKNQVLVKNHYSVISVGTEKSMVSLMKKPLYQMALERKDLTKQVLKFAKDQGIKKTMDLVNSRLDVWHLLGYSCSGEVVKVGKNVQGFSIGDKVACAGSGFANHAEYVSVPQNLVAKVPAGVDYKEASFSGVAAIALQSVRQLNPTLGENIAVIGLGLLGQLVCQFLKANGCNVIGIDIDKKRTEKDYIDLSVTFEAVNQVEKFTSGFGADGVIIAAATKANVVNDAFDMCRKKGRVVLLGVCSLNIDRQKMYDKELDFKISTSFGPGYYDPDYEEKGIKYPLAYVRWPLQQNMETYLSFVKTGKIDVLDLIDGVYPLEDAYAVYAKLEKSSPLGILFEYSKKKADYETELVQEINPGKHSGTINVGLIGAGNFIKGFIIPEIRKRKAFNIYAVCTSKGNNAKKLGLELNAKYVTTDYKQLLSDKKINLVIIGTRHDTHGKITIDAINAGKNIFVEKPLTIEEEELAEIVKALKDSQRILAVGFNRRYSPHVSRIKNLLSGRTSPIIVNYVFNNSYLPKEHWVNQADIGGGRFVGEACHILDLFNFLTGSKPVDIKAMKLSSTQGKVIDDNNIVATIKYEDGSVCNLVYSCIGNIDSEREKCTVFHDGNVYELVNYQKLFANGKKELSTNEELGYSEEIEALANAMQGKKNTLISKNEVVLATRLTFDIIKFLKVGVNESTEGN